MSSCKAIEHNFNTAVYILIYAFRTCMGCNIAMLILLLEKLIIAMILP